MKIAKVKYKADSSEILATGYRVRILVDPSLKTLKMEQQRFKTILQWLRDSVGKCGDSWSMSLHYGGVDFSFDMEDDAVLFALTWA